ncbi:MAG: 30S ribosomal protein S11, partial [Puniceicoccaceae bacterium]
EGGGKGPGMGRDSPTRAVQPLGMRVPAIADIPPVPHNGCRPKKRRRVKPRPFNPFDKQG